MPAPIQIGWTETVITPPERPVALAGQFYARVSEGVKDPLRATTCVLATDDDCVIFVACDLVSIPDELRDLVRSRLPATLPADKLILHATHTHTGPEVRGPSPLGGHTSQGGSGLDLGVVSAETYAGWLAGQLAGAVTTAWENRRPGAVAWGLDHAVLGRNRRWVRLDGRAQMYGLNAKSRDQFHHIEGFEDHDVNLLATYDSQTRLTGILVNIPCPAQEEEHGFELSADFWHETRQELRRRFGDHVFILPQCSAAGELTSHLMYEKPAHARMLSLRGRSAREEIAHRIADAVGRVIPHLSPALTAQPVLRHHSAVLDLPAAPLTQADADDNLRQADHFLAQYEAERARLEADPALRAAPRWYRAATEAFRRAAWHRGVAARFEHQKLHPTRPTEVHLVRLGDIAFASVPFEYYLDFGVRIKVRSPAVQTFLVQLAGAGTYVPSARSVQGGGYGSVPASNPVGPGGGHVLADHVVDGLRGLFPES